MKKVNRILFPTDFSPTAENAFRFALRIADVLEASLEVVHVVFPEMETADIPIMTGQYTQAKLEAASEACKEFIDSGFVQLQTNYSFDNLPEVDADIHIGLPVDVICRLVEGNDVDLIIMGTQGQGKGIDKFFGSVASKVVELAPCPVMVIPEEAEFKGLENIVFATDLEKADPYFIWETTQFLEPFDSAIRCVHVEKEGQKNRDRIKMEELESYFKTNNLSMRIEFFDLIGKSISEKLNEFIDVFRSDMVIMHSPKRPFFDRLFHKSQTKAMALVTKVPLLVLR